MDSYNLDLIAHSMLYIIIGYGVVWTFQYFNHLLREKRKTEKYFKSESEWMKFVQKRIDNIRKDAISSESDIDSNTTYVNEDGSIRTRQAES